MFIKKSTSVFLVFRLIFSLILLVQTGFAQTRKFIISNMSGVARQGDPVLITRENLLALMDIPEDKIPVLFQNDLVLPSQTDDLTGDGIWDELAFQVDMERNSSLEIKLKWMDKSDAPTYPAKVSACFKVSDLENGKYQNVSSEIRPDSLSANRLSSRYCLGGPVWESEKIAFRHCFDNSNFNGVLGKIKSGLLLDSIVSFQSGTNRKYNWGSELLSPDSGFGLGGYAMVEKGKLIPLRKPGSVLYKFISSGPVRAMFDLVYEDYNVGGNSINVRHRISIWAGKNWYKSDLLFTGFLGQKELVFGFSLPPGSQQSEFSKSNSSHSAISVHVNQGKEGNGHFGFGLLFPTNDFLGQGKILAKSSSPDSLSTSSFVRFKIRSGQTLSVMNFAAWEKPDDRFANAFNFNGIIQEEADRLEQALKIGKK